jgi:hypothetical protein
MSRTTVVNLKGHRDDPDYADVVYVGRAVTRGGWRLEQSPLGSPFRPGRDGTGEHIGPRTMTTSTTSVHRGGVGRPAGKARPTLPRGRFRRPQEAAAVPDR